MIFKYRKILDSEIDKELWMTYKKVLIIENEIKRNRIFENNTCKNIWTEKSHVIIVLKLMQCCDF